MWTSTTSRPQRLHTLLDDAAERFRAYREYIAVKWWTMYVTAIDPGWRNLAICMCRVDDEGEIEALDFELVDMNNMSCGVNCTLPHSSHVVHKVAHIFQIYSRFFETADKIFIEKQPMLVGSMLHVEALLYDRLQERAELVSPQVLHRHFGLKQGAYDERKTMVDDIAGPYLAHLPGYQQLERKHDVGDAFLLCRLYADGVKTRITKARKVDKIKTDLSRFKFVRPKA